MLRTLFGELAPRRLIHPDAPPATDSTPLEDAGAMLGLDLHRGRLDRAASDVVVDASPAAAMRAHFAATRADLDQASAMITLLDPSGLWASQVIRALSDAADERVERLALRERGTLRTLALIERTVVPRQHQAPLKVYHADIRATGLEQEEISNALAEGSHLTAVIIGAMPQHAVEALLRSLLAATRQAEWRCPWLVFLLPPGAGELRQRILHQDWPAKVRTAAMVESLTSAAGVWNTVLTAWEAAAAGPQPDDQPAPLAQADPSLQAQAVERALSLVARTEGLLACGLVNLGCGDLLATDCRPDAQGLLARTAAALCAAREAHIAALSGGGGITTAAEPPEELLVTNGAHQALLRALPQDTALGIVALIERRHANLALLRFRLNEAEKHLS